ncbi:hypothetical protein ACP70R_049648 [Stipagrostis hirtigluma subsp. patula]
MIEKTLSTFLPANRLLQQQYRRHGYVKHSALIYDLQQAEKHDELLTKNHQLRPVGTEPLPETHFNVHQNEKKSGGKKFKKNFKGKWRRNKQQNNKGPNKGKGIFKKKTQNDNSQVCQRCGCHSHVTKKCRTPKHLADLYQKSIGKQVKGDKIEAHFNARPTDPSCSYTVPAEHDDEKIPPQLEDMENIDDMIVELQSNDLFGDNN